MVGQNQLLYFADVCAGPGGFSEYVLYRKGGWHAKGFGFTLKESHDFELDNFYAAPSESFEPHYGTVFRLIFFSILVFIIIRNYYDYYYGK